MALFAKFLVANSANFPLIYEVNENIKWEKGHVACLNVKDKLKIGIFLEFIDKPVFACLYVENILYENKFPLLTLALCEWVAWYYLSTFNRSIHFLAPGFFWNTKDKKKQLNRLNQYFEKNSDNIWETTKQYEKIIPKFNKIETETQTIILREEQLQASNMILSDSKGVTLLFGVTGSGKTEVYLYLAQKCLREGKNVLILVPEIALTPQMTARFKYHFGDNISVLHSMLSNLQYECEWHKVFYGISRVVLGVRSSVFAPLSNLGLIIVDEEHDSSYKNEEFPCYNARDLAVKRSFMENARCVLGSATPALETWMNVEQHKYKIAKLVHKHSGNKSEIILVDAKKELDLKINTNNKNNIIKSSYIHFNKKVISDKIILALKDNLNNNEQSMIIINRRGYANFAICTNCGKSLTCPNCSVSTTLHNKAQIERCHYCSFKTEIRPMCPHCGSIKLLNMGLGTQNIEEELLTKIPNIKLDRLDRDVMTSNTRLAEILQKFRNNETTCLVGTQLLSKGHDFPKVTLVAVIHLEDGLFFPDFRANERTFQLLLQTFGRVGRAQKPGKVYIQSLILDHPVLDFACHADVYSFIEYEKSRRLLTQLPPYTRQILLEFKDKKISNIDNLANEMKQMLLLHWKKLKLSHTEIRIIGPQPATLEKLNNKYRIHICINYDKKHYPRLIIPDFIIEDKKFNKKLRIDVDPQNFM